MNMKWDADNYTNNFNFVHEYGNDVIKLLNITKGMTILDLGCGNGALTQRLSEAGALPTGMDSSLELLDIARKNHPDLTFIEADATQFVVEKQVDAVLSNAVFHWINEKRQPEMLQCVAKALKKNGQFVFEFGGCGNNSKIHKKLEKKFKKYNLNYQMPFYFPTIGEYASMVEKAEFRVIYATLFERPTALKGEDGLADWIKMFVIQPFENISDEIKNAIISETVSELKEELYLNGKWYADYVRIRMKAKRV